jgi:hypothetical protein
MCGKLIRVSLHLYFTDGCEVIVPLDQETKKPCCRLVDSRKTWLDAGPPSRVWFHDGTLRTIRAVGIFRCLPTIVGEQHGASSPTFMICGRDLIAAVESGELVDWDARTPRWRTASRPEI